MSVLPGFVLFFVLLTVVGCLVWINQKLVRKNHALRTRVVKLKRSNRQISQRLLQSTYTVQEAERRRISMDLHDEIGAGLTSLKYNIQALFLRRKIESDHPEQKRVTHDGDLVTAIDELIRRSKDIIYDISPTMLEQCGLEATLRSLFRRTNDTYTVIAAITVEGEGCRFTTHQQLMMYRVIQELLANAMKHSDRWRFKLHIRWLDACAEFQVEDECWMAEAPRAKGMGLANIRNRILLLGGEIHDQTSIIGHSITITIPYEERKN
jgi:signal transduction histidine kinase